MNLSAILTMLGSLGFGFVEGFVQSEAFSLMLVSLVLLPFIKFILRKRGIELDEKWNALLHEGLLRGLKGAAARMDLSKVELNAAARDALVTDAAKYVMENSPETVKHFGLENDLNRLKELALPHIIDVLPFPFNVIGEVAGKLTGAKK